MAQSQFANATMKKPPHSAMPPFRGLHCSYRVVEEYYGTNMPNLDGITFAQSMGQGYFAKRRRRSALSVAATFEKYEDLQR